VSSSMNATRALRRALGVVAAVAAAGLSATPAVAATPTMPTPVAPLETCTEPALSQPFAAYEDFDFYTLAPGGDFDSADNGWELTRGASILPATQPDGTTGGVLDLPSTAQAVSPPLCITSDYPTARLWVRNLAGSEGVFFYVSYYDNGVWTKPKNTGQFHGTGSAWTLSRLMKVHPSGAAGWQQVRFVFVAGGTRSRFQVDDFWVDPRMKY